MLNHKIRKSSPKTMARSVNGRVAKTSTIAVARSPRMAKTVLSAVYKNRRCGTPRMVGWKNLHQRIYGLR